MIIEIRYKALHWDHHQGGSGKPFDGRLLRAVPDDLLLAHVHGFAMAELEREKANHKTLMGDYILVDIVIANLPI